MNAEDRVDGMENASMGDTHAWEASFDPEEALSDFSFVNYSSSYAYSELKNDVNKLRWSKNIPEWAFALLLRGVGVHHAGMNKGYRSLVEA